MADGDVTIDLKLNTSQAESDAVKAGDKIGQTVSGKVDAATQQTAKSTKQAMNEIGSTMTSFGASYSKAVTLPIAAAATATGAAAVKIDTALTGVRKTVDGTEQEYQQLKDAAIEFSKTNAVDPAQILDIQALGAQLGYSIDELQMFGEVVSGLDIATNMNADEAATELAQFANIMGMAHSETKNYGSTIVELGNNFATTEADISHMAMRIAGAGKQIGMTEADVLGLATALSSMGIEAEAGGTAISTIMAGIDKSVAMNNESLKDWAATAGMSAEEFAKAWGEDAVSALSAVLVGMDDAVERGGNMSVMLDNLGITSIRQTDTLKRLASNSEFLGKAVDTANRAWEENVALDKEVENRNNSIAAQLEIAKNKVTALAIEVGEPLMKAIVGILDQADPLVDALASGAQAFADMDETGQRLVLSAVAIVAAIGPVSGVVGKVITSVNDGTKAWAKFKSSFDVVKKSLTTGLSQTSASVGAFTKYAQTASGAIVKWDKSTQSYVQTNSKLAKVLATSKAGITAQGTAAKVAAAGLNIASKAARVFSTALKTIAPIAAISAGIEIFGKFSEAIGASKEKAEQFKKATDGIGNGLDTYKKAFDDAFGSTNQKLFEAGESAKGYGSSLTSVNEKIQQAVQHQGELADKLDETWSSAGSKNAMVQQYSDTIRELAGNTAGSAEKQAKLQLAVDGLNSIMGTSYSIVDKENGVLNENVNVILASAKAWQERALAEAASAAYEDLMAQKIENATALAAADEKVTEAQKRLNSATSDFEMAMYGQQLRDAEAEAEGLRQADNALNEEMTRTEQVVAQLSNAYGSSSESLTNFINSNEQLAASLQDMDGYGENFIEALSSIGVSVNDLSAILESEGQSGIEALVTAYLNGSDELMAVVAEKIPRIGETYTSAMEENSAVMQESTQAAMDAQTETINAASEATNQAATDTANGIADAIVSTTEGRTGDVSAAVDGLVTSGMGNADGVAESTGQGIGNAGAGGIASGFGSAAGQIASTVANAMNQAAATAQGNVGAFHEAGAQSGNEYASGLNDGVGAASAAGAQISGSATDGLSQGVNEASQIGNNTSEAYIGEINKADARPAAAQLKDGAIGELNKGQAEAEQAGKNLGQGFINGMNSTLSGAIQKATELARSALDAIKREGQQGSPWKTTIQMGKFAGEGLGIGVLKMRDYIVASFSSVARDGINAMGTERGYEDAIVWEQTGRLGGKMIAKGIMLGFEAENPLAQMQQSIENGISAITVVAASSGGGDVYNNDNTQVLNFNQPVKTPDEVARTMRMQQHYGLAGRY